MLKLGVWKKEWFFASPPAGLSARLYYILSKTRVSMALLRVPAPPSAQDIDLFERLMPHVRLSSGVYRSTYRGRFRNLDPFANTILTANFSSSVELHVEDWAASTCLTSCEWAQTLSPLFPKLHFVASDILLSLAEIENPVSREIFVFEPDGRLLQYVRPPFVIRMEPPEPWAFPLNRLLYLYARGRWRRITGRNVIPHSAIDAASDCLLEGGYQFRKLPLVHPEPLDLARRNAWFSIQPGSIFETLASACHVIRSMNVLNRAYFSEEQLMLGIRSVIKSLLPGGIWIAGRTVAEDPPAHEVTIFRKQDSGALEVLERVGPGSEIEAIALAVR